MTIILADTSSMHTQKVYRHSCMHFRCSFGTSLPIEQMADSEYPEIPVDTQVYISGIPWGLSEENFLAQLQHYGIMPWFLRYRFDEKRPGQDTYTQINVEHKLITWLQFHNIL